MNSQREIFAIVRQVLALLLRSLRSQEFEFNANRRQYRERNMMHARRNFRNQNQHRQRNMHNAHRNARLDFDHVQRNRQFQLAVDKINNLVKRNNQH